MNRQSLNLGFRLTTKNLATSFNYVGDQIDKKKTTHIAIDGNKIVSFKIRLTT